MNSWVLEGVTLTREGRGGHSTKMTPLPRSHAGLQLFIISQAPRYTSYQVLGHKHTMNISDIALKELHAESSAWNGIKCLDLRRAEL